jgi:TPR repeat protein
MFFLNCDDLLNDDRVTVIDKPARHHVSQKLSAFVVSASNKMILKSKTYVDRKFPRNPVGLRIAAFAGDNKAIFALSTQAISAYSDGRISILEELHEREQAKLCLEKEFDGCISALTAAAYAGDALAQFTIVHYQNIRTQDGAALSERVEQTVFLGDREIDPYLILLFKGLGKTNNYLEWIGKDSCDEAKLEQARELAVSYLRIPARSGSVVAQHVLGMLTYVSQFDTGTKADFLKGATWLFRACSRDHTPSQYELGEMFRHNLFSESVDNARMARKFISLAARKNYMEASARMQELSCCLMCGADQPPLKCTLCRQAWYCNFVCSGQHWTEGGGVGGPESGLPHVKHKYTCTRHRTLFN